MLKRKRIWLLFSLLGIGVLLSLFFFFSQSNSQQQFLRPVESKIHQIEREFDEDFLEILMQNRPKNTLNFTSLSIKTRHSYYLFNEDNELIFWSDFKFIPDFDRIKTGKNFSIYEDQKGLFLIKIRRLSRNENGYWLIQVFPIQFKSEIENDFIPSGFNLEIFGNQNVKISESPQSGYLDLFSLKGDYLLSVRFEPGYQATGQASNITLLIFFFSLLTLVLIQGFGLAFTLWKRGKPMLCIFYLAVILFSIRGFMLFFNFPQDFFDYKLFDSSYFAASILNPSLGDFFLNILSLFIIVSLFFLDLSTKKLSSFLNKNLSEKKKWLVYFLVYFFSSLCLIIFYGIYLHIQSNAQWELNIQSVPSFDYFNAISLIIVFLGAAGYLLFSILSIKMVLEETFKGRKYAIKTLGFFSLPIVLVLAFYQPFYLIVYFFHVIFLTSVISYKLYEKIFKLGLNTFLTFFFGCFIAALITAAASYHVQLNNQQQSKLRFGEQQMVENDVIA
jgi:hypothetical protein